MALPLLASGLPQFCEICCPCGFTVWFRGSWLGGALVSAQCCVVFPSHRVRFGGFCDRCRFCLVLFDRHSNPEDDTMDDTIHHPSFSYRRHELSSWSPCPLLFVWLFVCFGFACALLVFLFCFFVLFVWFFLLALWQLIGLCTGPTSVHFWSSPSKDGWRVCIN